MAETPKRNEGFHINIRRASRSYEKIDFSVNKLIKMLRPKTLKPEHKFKSKNKTHVTSI